MFVEPRGQHVRTLQAFRRFRGPHSMSAHDSIGAGALPAEYSSFVGRRTQLAAARAALGVTRLPASLGRGGVGKTRFAIQLAMAVRRLNPEGTWFIDLSGVTGGSVTDEV